MSGDVAAGTGVFARLAQRASGARAELEPRLDARYAPATPGVRDAGLEVIEAEVPATGGHAADQPPLAPRAERSSRIRPPVVAESQPVRRSVEREPEAGERDLQGDLDDGAPAERWSTGLPPHDAPALDAEPDGAPTARTERTVHITPAMPDAPAVAQQPRQARDARAAVRPRAAASEVVTPRPPASSADTRAAPALDVEVEAGDDGIPWSLLTGPVEPADPHGGKEGGRSNAGDRALEPLNDGRALPGAAQSAARAEAAPEPDEIHVHIGRIEVAAPPVAPPRAARSRRQPRITLSDYLGLGSSRGGRR